MEKHFKLTTESIVNLFGVTLFRIELTIDCKWGQKGDKGGFVEKESNISGDAWVYGDARVSGDARVYGNAQVSGDAWVSGNAWVYGYAWEKSPLQIQGTKHFINFCAKGKLKIGCHELEINVWVEKFESIGKENGYTEAEIKEYGLYIQLAKDLMDLENNK